MTTWLIFGWLSDVLGIGGHAVSAISGGLLGVAGHLLPTVATYFQRREEIAGDKDLNTIREEGKVKRTAIRAQAKWAWIEAGFNPILTLTLLAGVGVFIWKDLPADQEWVEHYFIAWASMAMSFNFGAIVRSVKQEI